MIIIITNTYTFSVEQILCVFDNLKLIFLSQINYVRKSYQLWKLSLIAKKISMCNKERKQNYEMHTFYILLFCLKNNLYEFHVLIFKFLSHVDQDVNTVYRIIYLFKGVADFVFGRFYFRFGGIDIVCMILLVHYKYFKMSYCLRMTLADVILN